MSKCEKHNKELVYDSTFNYGRCPDCKKVECGHCGKEYDAVIVAPDELAVKRSKLNHIAANIKLGNYSNALDALGRLLGIDAYEFDKPEAKDVHRSKVFDLSRVVPPKPEDPV